MKKLIIAVIAIFSITSVFGQDAKKSLKNASKELAKYYQDQAGNAGKLDEAVNSVNAAFEDATIQNDPEAWITKGEIYSTIANSDANIKIVKQDYKPKYPNAALIAVEAFNKGLALAVKKNHTKDAIKGLKEVEGQISNVGISAFDAKDYLGAFKAFTTLLEVGKTLNKNSTKSILDDKTFANTIKYYSALAGYYGKADYAELVPVLEDMYNSGADSVIVYEALFNIKSKTNESEALSILEKGRKKYPEETGLLFAEINYYLGKGTLDALLDKLKMAIKKEPKNVSLYTTLANVYDQLTTKEREAKNIAKSQEYFDSALDYFNQAINIDPKNFDSHYGIGALYYNKAAAKVADLNKLSSDYSKEGLKKYDAAKAEMDGIFEQALPHFLKAFSIDNKDANVLTALKEIYARKGDFAKSNEFKAMLENLKK